MKTKKIFLTVLIGTLLFAGSSYAYARLHSNHSDNAFDGGDGTASTGEVALAYSSTIRELIIRGAEYFFRAHADINSLSESTERSDLYGADFFTLWWTVNSALQNMNTARYYYQELQCKANQTPYNPTVINKLNGFDYDSFQEQNGLIKDIFLEVKVYLANGDVRGSYSRTSTDFDNLVNILETIKGELEAGKVPSNNNMWKLNQDCAKVHMFGQYIARIFFAIK